MQAREGHSVLTLIQSNLLFAKAPIQLAGDASTGVAIVHNVVQPVEEPDVIRLAQLSQPKHSILFPTCALRYPIGTNSVCRYLVYVGECVLCWLCRSTHACCQGGCQVKPWKGSVPNLSLLPQGELLQTGLRASGVCVG